MATTEGGASKTVPAPKGKGNVDRQEEVADVVEREDAEHNIEDSTDGTKSEEIEKCIRDLQTTDGVVDSSQSDDDDGPNGTYEETKGKR